MTARCLLTWEIFYRASFFVTRKFTPYLPKVSTTIFHVLIDIVLNFLLIY